MRLCRCDRGGELLPGPGCPVREALWDGRQRGLRRRLSGIERGLYRDRHHLHLHTDFFPL
jgi:hypothetical protein